MPENLKDSALHYHRYPISGKVRLQATKPLTNQRDLALAYSPGVAAPCEEIVADRDNAALYTSRGNLVGVVTNGTAVLGLGNIGPLAAKPVMEGKAVLFKHFADIDAFDIEVDESDVDRFVDIVAAMEPTFGGINLEDIKAPQCFEIERKLRERMKIPVFHDDQHGTAIVTGAAVINGLRIQGKTPESVKLVVSGAGAAAMACTDLLVGLGIRLQNILMLDRSGVIHTERENLDEAKARYAANTPARDLADAINGADIFLGVSAPGVLTPDMVRTMAKSPLILALANPDPEIMPDEAKAARPDAIVATGRSDLPNQVNNVLCFPFLFRGALDVGATTINEEMKIACVRAIADIARAESSDVVAKYYSGERLSFGPDYILPKPFDPRLVGAIAPAVADAAIKSGVAERPIHDLENYRRGLNRLVYRSGNVMRPIYEVASSANRRIIYTDGENDRVLYAVQTVVDESYATPTVIGREDIIREKLAALGLRATPGEEFTVLDPVSFQGIDDLVEEYYLLMSRRGVHRDTAERAVRGNPTVLAALLVAKDQFDAVIVGPAGSYENHLQHIENIIGLEAGIESAASMELLILDNGSYFIADTSVHENPAPEQLAAITLLAAERVRMFGIVPKVALLSHSNFGSRNTRGTKKMQQALALLRELAPDLEVDGEMKADTALSAEARNRILPDSTLNGRANLLIMPTLDAANITFNALRVLGNGVSVGPILLGPKKSAHIVGSNTTARGIVNLTAVAGVQAPEK